MRKHIKQILLTFIFLSLAIPLLGRSKRVNQIPNGSVNSCSNCHVNPNGGGTRNDFGELVRTNFLDNNGDVIWGTELASMDADGDGVSNGDELQDQFGKWISGESSPGNSSAVSNPGDNGSIKSQMVTVHLSSMTPHAGNKLFIRAVDKSTGLEASRNMIMSLVADQNVELDNLIAGHSYNIDFFADFSGNGLYDAPPADHAWRLEANNIQGGETLEFSHNTDFIDIDWKYQLTINFSSMTPHVGQMFEISVLDKSSSMEVGRMKIPAIPSAEFSKSISGLKLNMNYEIKMYADFNQNGKYDSPPTDHAWSIDFTNNNGDASVNFTHNADFKDVGWKYLYTLNFLNMVPHVGEMLEIRVVQSDNNQEISRKKLMKIMQPDFSIALPNVELNNNYNVDFYVDHNGNGNYDAPPTDHAWRLTFNSAMGNYIENFTHNTDFTDIEWQNLVSVDENNIAPQEYSLKQNYPNPFNPSTNIMFSLQESGNVNLKVYNILGENVATLVSKYLEAGTHEYNFNAGNLSTGIYFYSLSVNGFTEVKKMILNK